MPVISDDEEKEKMLDGVYYSYDPKHETKLHCPGHHVGMKGFCPGGWTFPRKGKYRCPMEGFKVTSISDASWKRIWSMKIWGYHEKRM